MTNPYDPSEQLLNQIIVLENKITNIMSRNNNNNNNNNKNSSAIKRHRQFIKDKQSLLSRLHKIHREM